MKPCYTKQFNGFALFHNDDNKSLAMQFLLSYHDMRDVDEFVLLYKSQCLCSNNTGSSYIYIYIYIYIYKPVLFISTMSYYMNLGRYMENCQGNIKISIHMRIRFINNKPEMITVLEFCIFLISVWKTHVVANKLRFILQSTKYSLLVVVA